MFLQYRGSFIKLTKGRYLKRLYLCLISFKTSGDLFEYPRAAVSLNIEIQFDISDKLQDFDTQ